MNHNGYNALLERMKAKLDGDIAVGMFPLDGAVRFIEQERGARVDLCASVQQEVQREDSPMLALLELIDATSLSAACAIKKLGALGEDDSSGVKTALIDLWGRAEASRCLWFDIQQGASGGSDSLVRLEDLWESARLLAPEALEIAMRLGSSAGQYVEFATKTLSKAPVVKC